MREPPSVVPAKAGTQYSETLVVGLRVDTLGQCLLAHRLRGDDAEYAAHVTTTLYAASTVTALPQLGNNSTTPGTGCEAGGLLSAEWTGRTFLSAPVSAREREMTRTAKTLGAAAIFAAIASI